MLQIFIEWDPLRPRKVCKTASKKSSISLARSQHSCSASTRRPTRCVLSSFLSHHSTTGKKIRGIHPIRKLSWWLHRDAACRKRPGVRQ